MKTKWTKRILSLLLAVAVILPTGATAFAAETNQGNGSDKPKFQISAEPLSEEYKAYIASGGKGTPISSLNLDYLSESYAKQRAKRRTNALLPKTYDLRDYGLISPVRDQNPYGTCWTFSALGSAESDLIRQFPHISFSNVHLMWFSNFGDEEQEYYWYRDGDKDPDPFNAGGTDPMAVGTLAAWKGAVSSSLVPYDSETVDESLRYKADYHLQDAYYLTNGSLDFYGDDNPYTNTETMKQILMDNGAVSINYAVGDFTTYYNDETYAEYSDTFAYADHAVLIAGWDDNYPKENFKEGCRPKNDGAWLIRNSWGVEWGDDGYFWLSYEDKTIDYGCFYNMEAADNYARNYQYDTLGWCSSAGLTEEGEDSDKSAYMSNIFTSEAAEQLDAVSFYTTDAGTSYEISVYTGVQDGKPTSGKLAFSGQSGTEPYAGYHTIELDEPVLVGKDEKFSVVVKLTNPEYSKPIPVEICPMPIEKETPEFMGNGGESFVSPDGVDWEDAASVLAEDKENGIKYYLTNVCLKALTNPVSTVSFSLMEGPVTLGSQLELSSPGADVIYYTTDGSDPTTNGTRYTAPITIDQEMTVKAAAKKGGAFGAAKEKTYTKARSELVSLLVEQEGETLQLDLSYLSNNQCNLDTHVSADTETVRVQPQGADTITVNGKPLKSSEWSEPIPLTAGENTSILIYSESEGKTKVLYWLSVYRSALTYDFKNETVTYDEGKYTLRTGNDIVPSGASVTPYIAEDEETRLSLQNGSIIYMEYVPTRQVATVSPIDFVNEETQMAYGSWNEVADNPDMSDAVKWNGTKIPLTPGQNVYIRRYATDTAFESKVATLDVPDRPAMPENPGIDYQKMMTKAPIPDTVAYAFTEDGTGAKMGTGEKIALTPGTTLYLAVAPTDHSFASEVREVPVAAVPATPAAPEAEQATSTTVTLKAISGAEYRLGSGDWQTSPVFKGLEPETEYTFFIRIAATGSAPASEASTAVLSTGSIPAVNPSDYSFEVKYVDVHGDPAPTGGTQYFDAVGKVSREDIPMPYGYQAANIPAHPGDEWLNPTALEFIDDAWKVTNPVVTIEVEKQACVKIVFKTEDGADIEDAEYEEYYGEIGAGLVSVHAPDGYEIIGDDRYAVDVTRDADGNLIADPVEVVFVVKKVGTANPSNPDPSQPEKPSTPAQPGDKDIPNTGDSGTPLLPFLVLMMVSGGALVIMSKKRRSSV